MKKFTKIGIVVAIIILIGIIIWISSFRKSHDNGNLANMGLVIEQDGVIYYNKYEKGIFASKNGKEKQLTEETAYSLTFFDDKIYYITVADFSNVVIKSVDKNGENLKTIATIYTSLSKFFIQENRIYYATNKGNGGIACLDLQGQNEVIVVNESVQDFCVVDKTIFYTNGANQICKTSTSAKSICLAEEPKAQKIQVVGKWIYYFNENENALFRLSKDGKKDELVSVLVKNETYNVAGNYVYYFDEEAFKIARMKIGKSNQCNDIASISTAKTKINVTKNQLYYLDRSQDEGQTYQIYRVKLNGDEAEKIEY